MEQAENINPRCMKYSNFIFLPALWMTMNKSMEIAMNKRRDDPSQTLTKATILCHVTRGGFTRTIELCMHIRIYVPVWASTSVSTSTTFKYYPAVRSLIVHNLNKKYIHIYALIIFILTDYIFTGNVRCLEKNSAMIK